MMKRAWTTTIATVGLLLISSPTALACATCFGKSDSKLAEGMNWGIMSLLFVITSMLVAVSSFFVFVARRMSRLEAEAEARRREAPANQQKLARI